MVGSVGLKVDGNVATLTLDNEARRNAVSTAMWQQLIERAQDVAGRGDVRAVIVRGAGTQAFSAGADIGDFDTARSSPENAGAYDDLVEEACDAVTAIGCPTLALIHGPCMGAGVSIASSCDFRIADTAAAFAVPAARVGLGYDPRGVARLMRVLGAPATNWLLLTAGRLCAERAYALGFVAMVCERDRAEREVQALAARIGANAPLTTAAAKVAIRAHAIADQQLIEKANELCQRADASMDYQEGRRAFVEKRSPCFRGE